MIILKVSAIFVLFTNVLCQSSVPDLSATDGGHSHSHGPPDLDQMFGGSSGFVSGSSSGGLTGISGQSADLTATGSDTGVPDLGSVGLITGSDSTALGGTSISFVDTNTRGSSGVPDLDASLASEGFQPVPDLDTTGSSGSTARTASISLGVGLLQDGETSASISPPGSASVPDLDVAAGSSPASTETTRRSGTSRIDPSPLPMPTATGMGPGFAPGAMAPGMGTMPGAMPGMIRGTPGRMPSRMPGSMPGPMSGAMPGFVMGPMMGPMMMGPAGGMPPSATMGTGFFPSMPAGGPPASRTTTGASLSGIERRGTGSLPATGPGVTGGVTDPRGAGMARAGGRTILPGAGMSGFGPMAGFDARSVGMGGMPFPRGMGPGPAPAGMGMFGPDAGGMPFGRGGGMPFGSGLGVAPGMGPRPAGGRLPTTGSGLPTSRGSSSTSAAGSEVPSGRRQGMQPSGAMTEFGPGFEGIIPTGAFAGMRPMGMGGDSSFRLGSASPGMFMPGPMPGMGFVGPMPFPSVRSGSGQVSGSTPTATAPAGGSTISGAGSMPVGSTMNFPTSSTVGRPSGSAIPPTAPVVMSATGGFGRMGSSFGAAPTGFMDAMPMGPMPFMPGTGPMPMMRPDSFMRPRRGQSSAGGAFGMGGMEEFPSMRFGGSSRGTPMPSMFGGGPAGFVPGSPLSGTDRGTGSGFRPPSSSMPRGSVSLGSSSSTFRLPRGPVGLGTVMTGRRTASPSASRGPFMDGSGRGTGAGSATFSTSRLPAGSGFLPPGSSMMFPGGASSFSGSPGGDFSSRMERFARFGSGAF